MTNPRLDGFSTPQQRIVFFREAEAAVTALEAVRNQDFSHPYHLC